jgi:HK97 gp10 family phage protein
MAETKSSVHGLAELEKMLKTLPEKLERNIIRSALRAGAKEFVKAAQQQLEENGSVDSGDLRDSIRASVRLRRGSPVATVSAGGQNAFYAGMVEFGTAAHLIAVAEDSTRGAKAMGAARLNRRIKSGTLAINGKAIGPAVIHPGSGARPFMRPALDAGAPAATAAFAAQVRKRLTKAGLDAAPEPLDPEDAA